LWPRSIANKLSNTQLQAIMAVETDDFLLSLLLLPLLLLLLLLSPNLPGTNSTGGPIASAGAACTPNAQPVVRCVQAPPAIPNANPWSSKCRLLRTSKACTTTCAAGFQPQPAGSALTAKCTAGGVWQITGSCVSAAATCKGSPSAGANANPFTNCADGADGATCTCECHNRKYLLRA
jgi:hypothetical protein